MNNPLSADSATKRLRKILSDPDQIRQVLEQAPTEMNLSESIYYVAGYIGYEIGELEAFMLQS